MEDVLDKVAKLDDSDWSDEQILAQVKKWVSLVPETIRRNQARTILLTVAPVRIR
jgi:hypothetical protein